MSKIFTNRFKIDAINALIQSQPAYFLFVGRHTPYDDESNPPSLVDNIQTNYVDVYDQMLYARSLELSDVSFMIPRVSWTYGTVYNQYDHQATPLYNTNFYAMVTSGTGYDVFKCLSNAGGAPSVYAPDLSATSPSDDIYETLDGYQWKYMYSLTTNQYNKFATSDYLPVFTNDDVTANAVSGSIDYIETTYGGSNYDSYTNGAFQSVLVGGNNQIYYIESSASANANFYNGCAIKITSGAAAGEQRNIVAYNISGSTREVVVDTPFTVSPTISSTYDISPRVVVVGDGSGFVGRALVNSATSNSIYKIEITNRGQSYTFGEVSFVGNTGGISNTAVSRAIISPPGGHGSDPVAELGGHYMGLSVNFDSTELIAQGKIFDVNDFRVIGVMSSPQLANVEITYTGAVGTFDIGETVTQSNTGATGVVTFANTTAIRLTNVETYANFLAGNSTFGTLNGETTGTTAQSVSIRNNGGADMSANVGYINQTTTMFLSALSGTFLQDELVTGTSNVATSNAVVYWANSSVLYVTNVKGAFSTSVVGANSGATGVISSIRPGDLVVGSGNTVYIENIIAINKNAGQTETVKAVIEF